MADVLRSLGLDHYLTRLALLLGDKLDRAKFHIEKRRLSQGRLRDKAHREVDGHSLGFKVVPFLAYCVVRVSSQ